MSSFSHSIVAGTGQPGHVDATSGSLSSLNTPSAVAVHSDGSIFIADTGNARIRLARVEGSVTTFEPAAASVALRAPTGLAVESTSADSQLLIADPPSFAIIRRESSGRLTTAISQFKTCLQGVNYSTSLCNPRTIRIDQQSGTLFITDRHRIWRKSACDKVPVVVAGRSWAGQKDAKLHSDATFDHPRGLVVTSDAIYVADFGNNRLRVLHTDGGVSTLCGTSTGSREDGVGSLARFQGPSDLARLPSGRLLVADWKNNAIRLVDPISAQVSTLSLLDNAVVLGPTGLALEESGLSVIVAEADGHRISRIEGLGSL